jgi:thiamine pyrophosphate-dependent acetolactate synthase large subunit-like protein
MSKQLSWYKVLNSKTELAVGRVMTVTVDIFAEELKNKTHTIDQRPELTKRWKIWREEKLKRLDEDHGKGVSSVAVFDTLSSMAPENAVICVDVGNNAYSLGRYFECRKQSFLMSGYLGSIGFAFPAALGAWAATRGNRPVLAVAGDGGFAQYMAELVISVKYHMDIKLILLNNGELGKITKEQRSGGFEKFATDLHNPDFAAFARACGAMGIRVENKSDLKEAMKKVLNHSGTAVLEIMTDVNLLWNPSTDPRSLRNQSILPYIWT